MKATKDLTEALSKAKKEYTEKVANIKLKFKFKESSIEEIAKMLMKDPKKFGYWFNNQFNAAKRLAISQHILSKSFSVKVSINEGSYLDMRNLKLSQMHYSVYVYPVHGISICIITDLPTKPTEEQTLEHVRRMFPSIKTIEGHK